MGEEMNNVYKLDYKSIVRWLASETQIGKSHCVITDLNCAVATAFLYYYSMHSYIIWAAVN